MCKVIKNPKETVDRKMMALQLAFEGITSKIEMLKIVKQLYQDLAILIDQFSCHRLQLFFVDPVLLPSKHPEIHRKNHNLSQFLLYGQNLDRVTSRAPYL